MGQVDNEDFKTILQRYKVRGLLADTQVYQPTPLRRFSIIFIAVLVCSAVMRGSCAPAEAVCPSLQCWAAQDGHMDGNPPSWAAVKLLCSSRCFRSPLGLRGIWAKSPLFGLRGARRAGISNNSNKIWPGLKPR